MQVLIPGFIIKSAILRLKGVRLIEDFALNASQADSLPVLLDQVIQTGKAIADRLVFFITPLNLVAIEWGRDAVLLKLREERIEFIKAACADNGVHCIDLHDEASFQEKFFPGQWCHLNIEGRRLLA